METENLLKLLKEHKVRFVIIGAAVFPVHGYSRSTLDIDIFIKPEKSNAENTRKALKEFGYDVSDITIKYLLTKKLLIRQCLPCSFPKLELGNEPKGVTFDQVWENKVKARFGKTFVWFASLNDLIEMKRSAGRPKDLEDII